MQQLLLQQQKSASEINVKMENMYTDLNNLNNKYEAVSTHLKVLDTQVAQTADAMKRQQGVLPAKGEQNPRNGDGSNGSRVMVNHSGNRGPYSQGTKLELMMQQILDGQNRSAQVVNEKITALDNKMDVMNNELSSKFESLTCRVDCLDTQGVSTSEGTVPCNVQEVELKIKATSIPVTGPDQSLNHSDRSQSIPSTDQLIHVQAPDFHVKQPVAEEEYPPCEQPPVYVSASPILSQEKSIQDTSLRTLTKLQDPGKFVVPCSILGVNFEDSLYDSRASVNIMPKNTA